MKGLSMMVPNRLLKLKYIQNYRIEVHTFTELLNKFLDKVHIGVLHLLEMVNRYSVCKACNTKYFQNIWSVL